jgi:hypothetical protein
VASFRSAALHTLKHKTKKLQGRLLYLLETPEVTANGPVSTRDVAEPRGEFTYPDSDMLQTDIGNQHVFRWIEPNKREKGVEFGSAWHGRLAELESNSAKFNYAPWVSFMLRSIYNF